LKRYVNSCIQGKVVGLEVYVRVVDLVLIRKRFNGKYTKDL